jgi:hypothetical protein
VFERRSGAETYASGLFIDLCFLLAARRYAEVWGDFDVPTVSQLEEIILGQFLKDAVKWDKGLLAKTQ